MLARHIHHVWEQKSFCDFPMNHKREKCEHKCTRKTEKKKSLAGKPSWQVSIFPRFFPATRLAISFCYASPSLSLSLFSATVLSLPLSHFVSHCPSGTSLGKKRCKFVLMPLEPKINKQFLDQVVEDGDLRGFNANLSVSQ